MYTMLKALMLGHLLGDFVLGGSGANSIKFYKVGGAVIHALISSVTLVGVIFFLYGSAGLPLALTASVLHIIIDLLHWWCGGFEFKYQFILYLVDQLLHILSLVFLTSLIGATAPALSENTVFFIDMILMILLCSVFAIVTTKTALLDIYPKYYANRKFYELSEFSVDAMFGLSIFTAYFAIPFLIIAVPVGIVFSILYFIFTLVWIKTPAPIVLLKTITIFFLGTIMFSFI